MKIKVSLLVFLLLSSNVYAECFDDNIFYLCRMTDEQGAVKEIERFDDFTLEFANRVDRFDVRKRLPTSSPRWELLIESQYIDAVENRNSELIGEKCSQGSRLNYAVRLIVKSLISPRLIFTDQVAFGHTLTIQTTYSSDVAEQVKQVSIVCQPDQYRLN